MIIDQQKNLDELCRRLQSVAAANATPIALDTEFLTERRYTPQLCLVQIYCEAELDSIEALIDPFTVDLAPLLQLMAEPSLVKVLHAGSQDLQILCGNDRCEARNVFDTQIAAAFLGYGHQIGYADLVQRLIKGPPLSKAQQFTDWAARPLSPAQIEYALADVCYLPRLYRALRQRLIERGRLEWAHAECDRAIERATEGTPPDQLYRRLNTAGLSRRQLAALREVSISRDAIARSIDKPPSFVVPDATLLQMAKHPPANVAALRALRGMPNLSAKHAQTFMDSLHHAAELPPERLPELSQGTRPDPQTDVVANLLNVVTQLRATQHEISRTYLAPRDQLTALSAWWLRSDDAPQPDLPLLEGWRYELLGRELLSLLNGELAISLDKTARDMPGSAHSADRPAVRVVPLSKENDAVENVHATADAVAE